MCSACDETRDIVKQEIEKIIDGLDVDYIQFFDQYLGGGAFKCYSNSHGHEAAPGKWMYDSNEKMYNEIAQMLREKNKGHVVIGCEGAAAESNFQHLQFNDLRYNINYLYGKPAPAYNYVFHEYAMNFMGNQNTSYHTIDFKKFPDNIFYRFAYSFVQGDVLTVVLKEDGKIHWDWCTPWDEVEVNQKEITSFIEMLNSLRQTHLKDILRFWKMAKPISFECGEYVEEIKYGGKHCYPSVITSAFEQNQTFVQLFVNYLPYAQEIKISPNDNKADFKTENVDLKDIDLRSGYTLKIAPRSVVIMTIS